MTLKINYKLFLFLCIFTLLFIPQQAWAKKLVYIPIDDRPVNLKYTQDAVQAAGYQLVTPPLQMLSSRNREGDPEALWSWLLKNIKEATAVVISSDSLIYGGLVQSRTHFLPDQVIITRIEKLKELKEIAPRLRVYCFSSLLRTPRQSHGGVEPPYYEKYGEWFFRLGELTDKSEIYGYDYLDVTEIKNLTELIPTEHYQDWFGRRSKNLDAHFALAQLARNKFFHYYAVGKDDHAPLSQTHMEARLLSRQTEDISNARFHIIPGIDQLGLLLLTRAINEDLRQHPYIYPVYAEGKGPLTIPLYSDQTVGESVSIQIMAAGAFPTDDLNSAQLVLVANTPTDGINKEAIYPENIAFASPEDRRLTQQIKQLAKGKPVALADVAYANGADNGFMHELYKQDSLLALTAYSGWNTADNSIGYALSLGMLAAKQQPREKQKILQTRLLDDWYYQANVRNQLTEAFELNKQSVYYLDKNASMATAFTNKELQAFNKNYGNLIDKKFTAAFPWNRLFEIDITVK